MNSCILKPSTDVKTTFYSLNLYHLFSVNTTLFGEYVQIHVYFLTYKPGNKQRNYGLTFQDRNFLLQAFESPDRVIKESVVQSLGIPVFYDYRHSAHRQSCLLCFSRVERKGSDLTDIQHGTSDTTRLFFPHSILYGTPPHSYRVDTEMHEEIQQTVLRFQ